MVSCQKQLIERQANGTITVDVENSPVVDVVTKADASASADDFMVYVVSSENVTEYRGFYKDMASPLIVPVGTYIVSAENVTESQALAGWGQVRYYGTSEAKEVVQGNVPTNYNFTCRMVNSAASVVFAENIAAHFKDYSVTAYTVSSRPLVYNALNASTAVGYYTPGTLSFSFTGTLLENDQTVTISGSKSLPAATHLHMTFRISGQNGSLKPEITVDTSCTDLYSEITVDPSDGSFDIVDKTE